MLKKLPFFAFIFFLCGLTAVSAQSEKKVIIEHFTNTRCGICASRNPGFYANLNNFTDGESPSVLHLAIHPSAPYSDCVLHNNNPEENDDRTNFYGIYGGTPRLVIQGEVLPASTNYGNAEIIESQLGETVPFTINTGVDQQLDDENPYGAFEIEVTENNTVGEVSLFVALSEPVVNYDAPNGEDVHYDVFRKQLFTDQATVTIPANEGGFLYLTDYFEVDEDWNYPLEVTVILQDPETKEVIQAGRGNLPFILSNKNINELQGVTIAPNPVNNQVNITLENNTETNLRLTDLTGRSLQETVFTGSQMLNLTDLAKGIYFINLTNAEGRFVQKIIKE